MLNKDLQAFLLRFPPDAAVEVKFGAGTHAITQVELAFDATPIPLETQNIGWADLVKDKIRVQIVVVPPTLDNTGVGQGREQLRER